MIAFAILLAAILLGLKFAPSKSVPWARDPGPAAGEKYPKWDRWSWWHISVPGVICLLAIALGYPWWGAAILAYAVVEGWEWVEGYRDRWDVIHGVCSILVALFLYWLL